MRPAWICLTALAGCAAAAKPAASADGPVVIELFTSQGCSSCPPADHWLASLRPGTVVGGRPVLPLAFHVDYWNDLGWADPFSASAWTDRQSDYARRLGGTGVYTPEIVVAGRADEIGSHHEAIARLIAATPPTATLDARLVRDRGVLRIAATPPAGAEAWAAIVEDGLITTIHAGENAGAEAHDDHIVRALVRIDGEVAIPLDPAWGAVRVVAFAQAPDGAIVAARALE